MLKRMLSILIFFLALAVTPRTYPEGITLEQAIGEACARSDSAKMMRESLIKAHEMVREKWSNALPVFSATGYAGKNRGSLASSGSSGSTSRTMSKEAVSSSAAANDSTVYWPQLNEMLNGMFSSFSKPQTNTIYTVGLSVNQPLFTFGKIGTAIQVAKNFEQSAKSAYKRNMQSLQLQAVDAFSHAVVARKQAETAERSRIRKKELNDFLESNFKLGSGKKSQVLVTRADALNQSSLSLSAQKDALSARMLLNALMGRPLTDSLPLDTATMPQGLVTMLIPAPEIAVQNALRDRQDITSFQLLAKSTLGGARIFKAMYYPSIGLTGSYGFSKFESGSSILKTGWTGNWVVGIGAQWTFFDGMANSARAAQYRSDAAKLDVAANSMAKMIEIEIRSNIEECKAADSNISAYREALGAARESYDLTYSDFKQGSGQLVDLQLVDDQLQLAELGYTSARYRQVRSRAALLVALGKDIITILEENK